VYNRRSEGISNICYVYRTSEAAGQLHWWDTVFTEKVVQDFLTKQQQPVQNLHYNNNNEFCITLINPAGNGSVNGIRVEQMTIPYR
jgi:hypothetical protein